MHAICPCFPSKRMSCHIHDIRVKCSSKHHSTWKTCRRHDICRSISCHLYKCQRRLIICRILYKLILEMIPNLFPDLHFLFRQLIRTEIIKYHMTFFCNTEVPHQPCFFLIPRILSPCKDQITDQLFIINSRTTIQHTDRRHITLRNCCRTKVTRAAHHSRFFFYCHLFQYIFDLICHVSISCYLKLFSSYLKTAYNFYLINSDSYKSTRFTAVSQPESSILRISSSISDANARSTLQLLFISSISS